MHLVVQSRGCSRGDAKPEINFFQNSSSPTGGDEFMFLYSLLVSEKIDLKKTLASSRESSPSRLGRDGRRRLSTIPAFLKTDGRRRRSTIPAFLKTTAGS